MKWHVRTKDNIARVRRDEAKAAEEEKEKERRIKLAEQEARTAFLREKAREKRLNNGEIVEEVIEENLVVAVPANPPSSGHINFFQEFEEGLKVGGTNPEHEKEKKEEQEKYEKSIGLLTYLGQSSLEAQGSGPWYERIPDREKEMDLRVSSVKAKKEMDPLNIMRKYLDCPGVKRVAAKEARKRKADDVPLRPQHHAKKSKKEKKHKKEKKKKKKRNRKESSDSSSSDSEAEKKAKLEVLRMERLKREAEERSRAERLLAADAKEPEKPAQDPREPVVAQKYSSQFNPHLARQNLKPRTSWIPP
ncbi:unnamed protein product [Darwinula stevensoni]|uniref:CBF1-interacting co-repressor CIR N-terminal domain-containing protein n=1 Tax=Darwinula stevensoni TaxID=69355 RepID=A0A7R9FNN0_9CRUS|nr:unnamed protein product [Darwinula stevensoni]CAG0896888.1 unnamed protein product [Darwinula stevensoni]